MRLPNAKHLSSSASGGRHASQRDVAISPLFRRMHACTDRRHHTERPAFASETKAYMRSRGIWRASLRTWWCRRQYVAPRKARIESSRVCGQVRRRRKASSHARKLFALAGCCSSQGYTWETVGNLLFTAPVSRRSEMPFILGGNILHATFPVSAEWPARRHVV